MTDQTNSSNAPRPAITLNPWLVVLAALVVYGVMVDHWVTLTSLPLIARVTGWDWHILPLPWRQLPLAPLYLTLTAPIRILPVAMRPVALNLFSVVCASLTLGLLAASVRLLPQDRTREQRQREGGEFALLSVPMAFLPQAFAVVMLGLQLTFWRDAVSASADILDVLVFAFLVYCLLKFRVTQNDSCLFGFAFIYGLGTTNDWALIGYFPLFLVAMVWIKGVNFFNWKFLLRMLGCGFAGLLLYLLFPVIGALGPQRQNFIDLLHMELGGQSFNLHAVPRWLAAVAALPTILPLFFAGIKWPTFEGELSAAGNALTKLMFRVLHMVFLLLALVLFFEFRFSPSLRLQEEPGVGFLTFYYVGALCIGYFTGYLLLVYGKSIVQKWERRGELWKVVNRVVYGLVWALAVAAIGGLIYQNLPHIRAHINNGLSAFAAERVRDLPAKESVVMADDSIELYLLEAEFAREGKSVKHILIDTTALPHREYIPYLLSRYPELKKITTSPEKLPSVMPPVFMMKYLLGLSTLYPVYYLNPSFGYYFEVFYLIPHGLVYSMHPYEKDVLAPPLPTAQDIKENQEVWSRLQNTLLSELNVDSKLDPSTAALSGTTSVLLDYWGVELQKANYLTEANAAFKEAIRINPNNYIAKINNAYNGNLRQNIRQGIDTGDLIFKAVNYYRGIVPILKYNGPIDEPGLLLDFGTIMAEGKNFRQSAIMFLRRLQLLPGDPAAQLAMAKTFVDWRQPRKAFEYIRQLQANPAANKWDVTRVDALAYYAEGDFATAERILRNAAKENPNDLNRLAIMSEFYLKSSMDSYMRTNQAEGNLRLTNSLAYLDLELQVLTQTGRTPDPHYTVAAVLLKKAEIELRLQAYEQGISTLNRIIALQPENATAILNRAIAEIQINQVQAARDDYQALRKLLPDQPYVVDFGLADIASRNKDRPEEIRYLKRYLRSAPPDFPEYKRVQQRLKKLESQ